MSESADTHLGGADDRSGEVERLVGRVEARATEERGQSYFSATDGVAQRERRASVRTTEESEGRKNG